MMALTNQQIIETETPDEATLWCGDTQEWVSTISHSDPDGLGLYMASWFNGQWNRTDEVIGFTLRSRSDIEALARLERENEVLKQQVEELTQFKWEMEAIQGIFMTENGDPLFEPFNSDNLSAWINAQEEAHQAEIEALKAERDEYKTRCDEIAETATHMIIGGITEEKVNVWLAKRDIEQRIAAIEWAMDKGNHCRLTYSMYESELERLREQLRKGESNE